MSKYDEKYEAAGAEATTSHVRGIIQQMNEGKPSKEKSREVVVRPDGTKVVRVTKKRRVLVSDAEKRKAGRRSFMLILMGAFALCFIGVAVLLFRMSQMSGEAYVQSRADELKQAWGAESVTLLGSGVEGTTFHLSGIVAEFPAHSLVQHVELTDITGDLDTVSFFNRRLMGDKLTIGRAEVRLNPEARALHMPLFQGKDLWNFRRVECDNFHVSMGDIVKVKDARSYMYHPRATDKTVSSLVISGGTVELRGMKLIRLRESKWLLTPRGVEEFSLNGTTDRPNEPVGRGTTSLAIYGRIPEGESLAGPFEFDSDGMSFSEFTEGRFGNILTARTAQQAIGREHSRARIQLPLELSAPVFSGDFSLKQICLSGFPVQQLITSHMESGKRSLYQPAVIGQGHVRLQPDGAKLEVIFPENQVEERDLMSLEGNLALDADNTISGTVRIGIPAILTHAEFADGKPDPIFRENAGIAWVETELSGTVNVPADNSAVLVAQTEEARKARPGRLDLDAVDFDKVSDRIRRDRELFEQVDNGTAPAAPAAPSPAPSAPQPQRQQMEEDLFGTPASGSLDMSSPLDSKGIFD